MLQFENVLALRPRKRVAQQRRILVVNGHPDPSPQRFCAALCDAYEEGAQRGGWAVKRLEAGALPFGDTANTSGSIATRAVRDARSLVDWADRLTVVFPLWLDKPPPHLSAVFRQIVCQTDHTTLLSLTPPPSRMVITMEMPAFAHRALLRDDDSSAEFMEKVALAGVSTDEVVFIGSIGTASADLRRNWLDVMRELGVEGN
jgi:putative NADPH-quinone reductase